MKFITLEEVIRFAVEREDEAHKLYKYASELSDSPAAKKLFDELAAEEAMHKEVFSKISIEKAANHKLCKIPETSISRYLANVELKPNMTYQEILVFSMKSEDNAYNLYKTAAGMTDDERVQKVLMTFADAELGHRRKLESIYEDKVLTEG